MSDGGPVRGTFAEKLDYLFTTVHPRGRRPYSLEEASAAMAEQGHELSPGYLWTLRRGKRDNPTLKTIEALAQFFGVPAAYFLDDELAARVDNQLELLAKMRDVGAQNLDLRSGELGPEAREALANMVEMASKTSAEMSPEARETFAKVLEVASETMSKMLTAAGGPDVERSPDNARRSRR